MPKASQLEQWDKEADELLKQANQPANPPADPPAEPEPEPEPEPNKEPEQPEPSPPADSDELDGLTLENAQERIRNAQARMHRATREAAELRRENKALAEKSQGLESEVARLKQELEAAKNAPPATDSAPSGEIPADLEGLKEDYPSLYEKFVQPLLTSVTALQKQVQVLGGQVGEVSKTVAEKAKEERAAEEQAHIDAILKAHPDAFDIRNSDEFEGWLDRQTPMTRRAIDEGTAADVIEVLDRYKQAVGSARINQARAAATPATPRARTQPKETKPTFKRSEIAAMSPEEFQRREAEIDEAMKEGRIVNG
ncbi:MAG TPA: hypothetical protein VF161_10520 [Steroidobacteraceae bacterium]